MNCRCLTTFFQKARLHANTHACLVQHLVPRTMRLTRSLPGAVSTHPRRAGCSSTSSVEQHLATRGQSGRAGQRAGESPRQILCSRGVVDTPMCFTSRRHSLQTRHSQPLSAALPLLHPHPTRPRNAQGRPRTSRRADSRDRAVVCMCAGWMLASRAPAICNALP